MKDKNKRPGSEKNTSLDARMKAYEAVTDYSLVPGIPTYVRIVFK